ncbi:hypothetical protein SAMN04488691_101814 [Haloferax larsenii]|uniref:Uncharacterized protein n=2 Tax=Haloferax larsenii TaxID=302484 RepID=A0A1H7IAA8_HALLR|nr:hypothetical protein SAMN04488691_101814 [Haloferax larsenii]
MSRGQAYALEAFVAATVLLASVTFALQVTAVTPLTASTSSQHIENQQAAVVQGLLDAAAENGTLERTVLLYNGSSETFYGVGEEDRYVTGGPPTAFGTMLNETFLDRGIAFNVHIHYFEGSKSRRSKTLVYMGSPSDHAVSGTSLVTLSDSDELHEPIDGAAIPTGKNLSAVESDPNTSFYVGDRNSGPLWAPVEVEVVVWRM